MLPVTRVSSLPGAQPTEQGKICEHPKTVCIHVSIHSLYNYLHVKLSMNAH